MGWFSLRRLGGSLSKECFPNLAVVVRRNGDALLSRLVLNVGVAHGRGFTETAPHERSFVAFGAFRSGCSVFRCRVRYSVLFGVRFYHRKFRARGVRMTCVPRTMLLSTPVSYTCISTGHYFPLFATIALSELYYPRFD
jgi:hypothetical protein